MCRGEERGIEVRAALPTSLPLSVVRKDLPNQPERKLRRAHPADLDALLLMRRERRLFGREAPRL